MKLLANVVLIIVFSVFCFAQDWNGLTVLKSTRKDVEKVLGKPSKNIKNVNYNYYTDEETILLDFASGKCTRRDSFEWKVKKGTLVNITIYKKKRPLLSTFDFDIKTFSKEDIDFHIERRYYRSPDRSISLEVSVSNKGEKDEKEEVLSIIYSPKKEDYNLLCPVKSKIPTAKPKI